LKAKRPYHHGDLRAALITAALSLIDQHGVQGLALSDAAHLAGVSVAAPYRHFKDKEALLAEIAAEGFTLFRNALAHAFESHPEDKGKRLVEMGVAYVDFALRHRSHFRVMWETGIVQANYPEIQQTAQQAYRLLEEAANGLHPRAHPTRQQALVRAAWSLVHGYAMLTLAGEFPAHGSEPSDRNLLRQSLHLLVDQFAATRKT
jgi:AcrR family transcriptional regulator